MGVIFAGQIFREWTEGGWVVLYIFANTDLTMIIFIY